jgi:flagellar hook-associated protein 3 FlgL
LRITQNMITRNYLNGINFSQENIAKANQRITSSRRFTRISENLADGSRALKVRKQLAVIRQQKADVRDAQGLIASAESNLQSINSVLHTAHEKALRGKNDPLMSVRNEIGQEIDNLKDQILQFMNTQYAGKFVMGSANNRSAPYQVDANGVLTFNGVPVDDIQMNAATGKYEYDSDGAGTMKEIPYDKEIYIDLGMGLSFDGGGEVDERSAFLVSFNGLDILGYGTETYTLADGTTQDIPNNIYNLMEDIVDMFRGEDGQGNPVTYNEEIMGTMLDKLEKERENMFLNITDLGNRDNFLERTVNHLESDEEILTGTRSELEGVDDAGESIRLSMYQYSWLATLKMGAKLLPQSLMDYLN